MVITTVANRNDEDVLTSELEVLRSRLNTELEHASRIRETYEAECRRSDHNSDNRILGIKQQFEIAEARVMGTQAEIAYKHRLLDEAQGREAEESRESAMQKQFERASVRVTESRAEVAKLRAEYAALPERIRIAEFHFHEALRDFNAAKEAERCANTR